MKCRIFAIITLIFLAAFVILHQAPRFIIHSGGTSYSIKLEIADDNEARRKGLMGRDHLGADSGMLFVYEQPMYPVMWMKDMLIPLDMLFISDDLTINHIESQVPPCREANDSSCARYRSLSPSSWVLELPAGYAEKHGLQVGDKAEIH